MIRIVIKKTSRKPAGPFQETMSAGRVWRESTRESRTLRCIEAANDSSKQLNASRSSAESIVIYNQKNEDSALGRPRSRARSGRPRPAAAPTAPAAPAREERANGAGAGATADFAAVPDVLAATHGRYRHRRPRAPRRRRLR